MTSTAGSIPCADCTSVVALDLGCGDFKFTDSLSDFVRFDFDGDGIAERTAWPARGEMIAFLVLDRDSNGRIDSGREMFVARSGDSRFGSTGGLGALAVLDSERFGGNGDRVLTKEDPMFLKLRLWTDIDHDGRSHPSELTTLLNEGIEGIDLTARKEQRADSFGNRLDSSALVSMNGVSSPKAGVVALRSEVDSESDTVASLRTSVESGSGH